MQAIADFLAHEVKGYPTGISTATSGISTLWETLMMDAVRGRAVEVLQRKWRDRLLWMVARAQADVVRQKM